MTDIKNIGRFRLPTESIADAVQLGNRLRTYLLTFVWGMAARAVRIEGVAHEYQALPNAREDALELIGNIRNVRVSSTEDSVCAMLDSSDAEVKAGDLKLSSGAVVNPEHVLAHLSSGAALRMEVLFERGQDYRMIDPVGEGYIPIEGRFCPVDRVAVEPGPDALMIAVETNGVIDAEEALREAMRGIDDMRKLEARPCPDPDLPGKAKCGPADLGPEFAADPFAGSPPPERDVTRESYAHFLEHGIPQALHKLFPLVSGDKRLDLVSHRLEAPEKTAEECVETHTTYESRLYLTVRIKRGSVNSVYGVPPGDPNRIVEQEIDMGAIPIVTDDGRFVLRGGRKTWVSTLGKGMRFISVGEIVSHELEVLIERMKPVIEERIRSVEWLSVDILKVLPLTSTVSDLLNSTSFCQWSDETNILSVLVHKNRTAVQGFSRRDMTLQEERFVKPDQFGRIDYLETPEGPNIGWIGSLGMYAIVGSGELLTPYRKVTGGNAADELTYFSAREEASKKIADVTALGADGKFREEWVLVRDGSEIRRVRPNEVELVSVSPVQSLGYSTAMIPFLGHNDPNRALQGANMQRQAVPLIAAEQPLVKTGVEARVARDSGQMVIAKRDGKVVRLNSERIVIRTNSGKDTYDLKKFQRSHQATCINQRPIVSEGDTVREGQVLADASSTRGGEAALGRNVLVAYMPMRGYNFEDAICISDELLHDETFTSLNLEYQEAEIGDVDVWVAPTGARVKPGDVLVQEANGRRRPLLTAPLYSPALVFGHTRNSGRIKVMLAQKRRASVGDKFAGRHGNKGCIARVLPRAEMPYMADGTPVQMVLNTLGIVSRQGLGQVLEMHYGLLAHSLGTQVTIPPFMTPSHDLLRAKLKEARLPESGMMTLYDGMTGRPFESDVAVGYLYMMKLAHMAEDKVHAVSVGGSSLLTHQPMGWRSGQRVGFLEMWALEAYGAGCTLQEFMTIKSDDLRGREKAAVALLAGEDVEPAGEGESLQLLENALRGIGISVEEERQ